jgi:hypothetical protein
MASPATTLPFPSFFMTQTLLKHKKARLFSAGHFIGFGPGFLLIADR